MECTVPFPARAFFEDMIFTERSYMHVLNTLAQGASPGLEGLSCLLVDTLDEGEPPFTGVRFSFLNYEKAVISYDDFENLLDHACAEFVSRHPEQAAFTRACLQKIHKRIKILRAFPVENDTDVVVANKYNRSNYNS